MGVILWFRLRARHWRKCVGSHETGRTAKSGKVKNSAAFGPSALSRVLCEKCEGDDAIFAHSLLPTHHLLIDPENPGHLCLWSYPSSGRQSRRKLVCRIPPSVMRLLPGLSNCSEGSGSGKSSPSTKSPHVQASAIQWSCAWKSENASLPLTPCCESPMRWGLISGRSSNRRLRKPDANRGSIFAATESGSRPRNANGSRQFSRRLPPFRACCTAVVNSAASPRWRTLEAALPALCQRHRGWP